MKQNTPRITVVGSSNMDLVVRAERIPAVGETMLGGDFIMVPGGKGANQAVAAAKLGAQVIFVARLGNDLFAEKSVENFEKEGVDTRYVTQTPGVPSGVALIIVDNRADNSIVVAPGANLNLSPDDVKKAEADIASSQALVAQLEIPLETVRAAADLAKKHKVPFILDPAPACTLDAELLEMVDVLTPNETEARILTGVRVADPESAKKAARILLDSKVKTVILTMGARGYFFDDGRISRFVQAPNVRAVDSTAAGDAFTAALAVAIANGKTPENAARFANYVAALSVTKMGAQPSMPTGQDVENFIQSGIVRE